MEQNTSGNTRNAGLDWTGRKVAEISDYQFFSEKKPYRLVVSRIKRKDKQTGLFTEAAYT